MPTRVFVPPVGITPRGSKENSRLPSREVTPRSTAAPGRRVADIADAQVKSSIELDVKTNMVTEPIPKKRVADKKASAVRRARPDALLVERKSTHVDPETAARGSDFASKLAFKQEAAIKLRSDQFDLTQPINIISTTFKADDKDSRADLFIDQNDLESVHISFPETSCKDDFALADSLFKQSLRQTRDTIFFAEPPREKQLFHWENHVAPMETMQPVAVDTYFKLSRVSRWKDSMTSQEFKMKDRSAGRQDVEDLGNIFCEDEETAYPQVVVRTSTLGRPRNIYQETIASVFDAASDVRR